MQKILKMTDITATEVKRELSYIRYVQLLAPQVTETEEGVILTCEVTDQNRLVYAEVMSALSEFVYTDTDQTAFQRVCDIAEVRDYKFTIIEQGTRGKLVTHLLDTSPAFDSCLSGGSVVISSLKSRFSGLEDKPEEIVKAVTVDCDVAVLTQAEFEENPLVPSVCHVYVATGDNVSSVSYQLIGTKAQVAERLTFLAACFIAKKMF